MPPKTHSSSARTARAKAQPEARNEKRKAKEESESEEDDSINDEEVRVEKPRRKTQKKRRLVPEAGSTRSRLTPSAKSFRLRASAMSSNANSSDLEVRNVTGSLSGWRMKNLNISILQNPQAQ